MNKTGVLLINLGTPDSPSVKDVRTYLKEFLMDKYVIDLPYLTRWFLVNIIISNFRAPKSAKVYQKLWTEKGSPLLFHGLELKEKLQSALDQNFIVKFGMRYQNPTLKSAIQEFKHDGVQKIIVIPLYPQYASSTTKSSIEKVSELLLEQKYHPKISFVENFLSNKLFIQSFVENASKHLSLNKYDHVLFSYHGVPERHILKDSVNNFCQLSSCCNEYKEENRLCYRAQCYETSRLIAKELNLDVSHYTVVFQSRLETRAREPWLSPYADLVTKELAEKGFKNVLVFSPSFVADCLETTIEVGEEFKEIFIEHGGQNWQLVESLNTSATWVNALMSIILENIN